MQKIKYVLAVALLFCSQGLLASGTTWDFRDYVGPNPEDLTIVGSHYGNYAEMTVGTNSVNITSWGDTGAADTYGNNAIETGWLHQYPGWGLGTYNQIYGDDPNIDSWSNSDFLLFTFDQAVSITNLDISWVKHAPEMLIAALPSLPSLLNNTWSTVLNNVIYQDIETLTSSTILNVNPNQVASKYWLIGAYFTDHCVGGAFNLGGLTTHVSNGNPNPPTNVSAPPAFLLIAVALLVGVTRRQKVDF